MTQAEMEKDRFEAKKADQANETKPGEKLRQTDPEAYANTYNEDGSLKIKTEKPLATGSPSEVASYEKSTEGDSIESEIVDAGEGHPQSEGSEKVEVKHPKTAEEQDDANKSVKHDSDPKQPASGRAGDDTAEVNSKEEADKKVADAPASQGGEGTKAKADDRQDSPEPDPTKKPQAKSKSQERREDAQKSDKASK